MVAKIKIAFLQAKTSPIFLIILLAFFVKVFLSNLVFHVDILSQAAWGQWIFDHGPLGFYNFEIWIYSWPNYPPLGSLFFGFDRWLYWQILEFFRFLTFNVVPHTAPGHMVWWFDFIKWFDIQKYDVTILKTGFLMTIKLPLILADLALAVVSYYLAKSQHIKYPLIWPLLFLLSPFSFYLSSFWGQSDNLDFLLVLVSFLLLYQRKIFFSIILLSLALHFKPTAVVFLPFFLWLLIKQKTQLWQLGLGIIASLVMTYLIIVPFTNLDVVTFTKTYLFPKVVHRAEFRLSTNSFNFWHILIGNKAFGQDYIFLFLPAKLWGYGIFALINLFAFKLLNKVTLENIFKAMFLVSFSGWLFLTNMLERYEYAAIASLFFLTIYRPRFIKYFLILSLIFWVNLYHGWWFPQWLEPLRQVLIWQEGLIARLLSVINVVLFFQIIKMFSITKVAEE
ncbi:MAG: hypothetical protein HYW45_00715 [Candidatus Daviesbacteria bacterium]|nr:MAG: hypothetical protein HYW45_00715 [Candidatus Daviesbacteria bacterium]